MTGWDLNLDNKKFSLSLDRIDSKIAYVKSNVQWVHKDVNWMKNKFSVDRFKEVCFAVYKNNN